MRLRFISLLLVFISSYFPLSLICTIKDLDNSTYFPQHPITAVIIALVTLVACIFVIVAVRSIKTGVPVRITKVSYKSGDMSTYTIPYLISFYNFPLGDWKTLLCLFVFMTLMFALSYKTQYIPVNPVLALAGYGLYDCQFKDGNREVQGLLISRNAFEVGDTCVVERLSDFLYFVARVVGEEEEGHAEQAGKQTD